MGFPDDQDLCLQCKLYLCASWYLLKYFCEQVECSPVWKLFLREMYVSVSGVKRKLIEKNGTDGSVLMACSSVNGASQSLQPVT